MTARRQHLLLLLVLLLSFSAYAEKKDGKTVSKQTTNIYAPPEPDVLPSAPLPDRPMANQHELILSAIRTLHVPNGIRGIDVSHYQGQIDWRSVAKDNVAFAYIKATESSGYVDPFYLRNLVNAHSAGIPVGVYHFFSPSTSALVQLANFKANVDPRQQDLIPIVDVEKRGKKSLSVFQAQLRGFLDEVERIYGVKPIIYTGVNFYNDYLAGRFTQYPFMIARYAEVLPQLDDADLNIILWQFTSKGRIQGIKGDVDCSTFLDRHDITDILLPGKGKK